MHFAIRYLTEYRYDGPVTDNLNALRVTPATTATQRVDDFGVRVEPQARLHQHLDYYGTSVIEFGIAKAHGALSIDVRARVATGTPPAPQTGSWPATERDSYRGPAIEFLLPYAGEPDDLRVDELVGLVRADTPLSTLEQVVQVIPDRFEYRAGVTYVGSKVEDLLDAGAGVCQDFAHLALVLLRRNGIAARYVSGYLFAPPEGREDADSAEVETHAWLEALVPPDADGGEPMWVGIDPTNRCLAGETYVKIGHGRHSRDVPPVKGVYRGTATAELDASVRMHVTDAAGARV
jgi:transglutaminase-like putative cysteine protease